MPVLGGVMIGAWPLLNLNLDDTVNAPNDSIGSWWFALSLRQSDLCSPVLGWR
jgi:hypothetical protein